jgi:hypothetical protein
MTTTMKHKRSSVAGNAPDAADIETGELAINFPDAALYTKDGSGNIIELSITDAIKEPVKNVSGGSLSVGTVVYQSGTAGNSAEVQAASNSSASTMPALGIITSTLADEAEGYIVLIGKINHINTSSFNEGDTLYVGASGTLTTTVPSGEGALIQNIGKVLKVHASNGSIMVTGAGRTNATPNLNDGNIFIGNSSNQATTGSLDTLVGAEGYIKDYTVTQGDVTAHEAALSVATSQLTGNIDLTSQVTGTLPVSNMAATALTTVQTAASESAQLALTAQEGDVVVRSDENKTYMHNGGSAGTMADFTLLATPTDSVTSVDGNTGAVTTLQLGTTSTTALAGNTSIPSDLTDLGITDGTNTQVLSTDGSGNFSFVDAAAGTDLLNDTTPQLGGDLETNSNDIKFADNDKAIFGAGSDLQIYHDGNDSYINDSGVGDLKLGGNQLQLNNAAQTKNYIYAVDGAQVELKYNNALKLATTSTGIDVTGTVTADGLTVDDVFSFDNSGFNGEIKTYGSGTGIIYDALNGYHTFRENGTARMQIRAGGDIYLGYEDTGTTPKLFWDASAERLGLGTTSPSAKLDLVLPTPAATASSGGLEITEGTKTFAISTTGSSYNYAGVGANELWYYGNSNFGALTFGSDGAVPVKFISNGSERMRINDSGNVGIGTSSPARQVHLHDASGDNNLHITNSTTGATATDGFSFVSQSSTNDVLLNQREAANMRFLTSNTERMRIDSSGNVLVGTTDALPYANNDASGIALRADGNAQFSRSGAATARFNRGTSDGEIVSFGKNGTAVGSIGTVEGDIYVGTGDTGLLFNDANNQIRPYNSTAQNSIDNAIDIGRSSTRFKDLHLGGTAYAGSAVIEGSSGLGNLDATLQVRSTETMAAGTGGTISLMGDDGTGTQRTFGMIKGAKGNASSGDFGGGLEFYTRTNGVGDAVKRMVIDQQGQVGIGTDSPDSELHILTSDAVPVLKVETTSVGGVPILELKGAGGSQLKHVDETGAGQSRIDLLNDGVIRFADISSGSTQERMRIDSSGRVGIGTDSPDKALTISASDSQIRLYDADGTNQFASFQSDNGTTHITSRNNTSHGSISFRRYNGTTVAESMRIDSSGNLLVGTTDADVANSSSVEGISIRGGSNFLGIARSGSSVAKFNRQSNDGSIVQFAKDGTTVGSIGTQGGAATIGNGVTGLRFSTAGYVHPHNITTNTASDNTTDLGASTARFKDLHLGGTAYVDELSVDDYKVNTTETSTSATTQVAIKSISATSFRSARLTVQVTNTTDSTYHLTEVLVIHDGTTPSIAEYGTIFTGAAAEATFDADISSNNLRLLATPASADSMTFKVVAHAITS